MCIDKEINYKLGLNKNSKLSLFCDNDFHFSLELKNLNRVTTLLFIYIILEELKKRNYLDKTKLLDMIDNLL